MCSTGGKKLTLTNKNHSVAKFKGKKNTFWYNIENKEESIYQFARAAITKYPKLGSLNLFS